MFRPFRFLKKLERGQIIVFSALLLPILLGMTGMAIDVGTYADDKRSLQNAADAIALAAGQDLPNSTNANSTAMSYATKNNIQQGDVSVVISGGTSAPKVSVDITRDHDFHFIRIFGISNKNVHAHSAAVKVSFGGGAGIVPWTVTEATLNASTSGALVTMKYDSNGVDTGNFGAIRIDGSGSSVYGTSVKYGSSTVACSDPTPHCDTGACPGSYPNTCAETSPECDGPDCTPQTGNLIGDTRAGVDFRMNNTSTTCDSFNEVFTAESTVMQPPPLDGDGYVLVGPGGKLFAPPQKQPTDTPAPPTATKTNTPAATATKTNTPIPTNTPVVTSTAVPATNTPAATPTTGPQVRYTLNPNCNPYTDGPGACATTTSICSRRVIIIPVVDGFGNGASDPATILKFALVFLEGYENGKCQGSSCEIKGRFVLADVSTKSLAGIYDPQASIQNVRLSE